MGLRLYAVEFCLLGGVRVYTCVKLFIVRIMYTEGGCRMQHRGVGNKKGTRVECPCKG